MAHDSKGITQFYLPPTHEPYLPLILRHTALFIAFWLVLTCAYPRRDGQAELTWGGWLYTETGFLHREFRPELVTCPSTNRAWCRVTSLIETNVLPLRQITNIEA